MILGIDISDSESGNRLWDYGWNPQKMVSSCFDIPESIPFGANILFSNQEPIDRTGHGTHVSGILYGVLYQNSAIHNGGHIDPIHVKFTRDDSEKGNLFDALCGVYLAIEQGADIINCSWGVLEGAEGNDIGDKIPYSSFLFQQLEKDIEEEEVLLVAGMGNDSLRLDDVTTFNPASLAKEK